MARLVRQRMLSLAAVVCLLAPASFAPAQEKTPDACLERTVVVNVLDEDGHQVLGLTPADFRGEFRGDPVKILSVTWDTGPRRLVLVFDAGRSMSSRRPVWIEGKRRASDLLVYAPQSLELAMVLSFEKEEVRVPFGLGREAALTRIADLPEDTSRLSLGWGQSPLGQAIVSSVDLLGSPRRGDTIYLITTFDHYIPDKQLAAAEKKALAGRVRIFEVLLSGDVARWNWGQPNLYGPDKLKRLAEDTGGIWLFPRGDINRQLHELYDSLHASYLLQVELPRVVDKERDWKLEVVDAQGKKRKELLVAYPQKLIPCGTAGGN